MSLLRWGKVQKTMKFAIVDDEKKATDLIETYIVRFVTENHFEIQTSVFHNPEDFLEAYTKDYDLVFLDVEMPGLNGIETAKELRRMDSNVVIMFITNMAQYAIHGYEVEAVDYVLKPLSYADFAMKVQKALRYIARNEDANVKLCTKDGMVHLAVSDIYYIEVRGHYLIYHTTREEYMARGVMKETEEQFARYQFARCSHGYLINLKYVQSVSGNIVTVAGEEIALSRSKKNDFMEAFARYIGGMQS